MTANGVSTGAVDTRDALDVAASPADARALLAAWKRPDATTTKET